jgi:ankyrin repeat protein
LLIYVIEEDEDFTSIKSMLEQKKKDEQKALELDDPSLAADPEMDTLDITLTDWDNKFNALQFAVFFGFADVVQTLIEAGAEVNAVVEYDSTSFTMLHLALLNNSIDVAKVLIARGVSVEKLDTTFDSVLHKAAAVQNLDFIKLIIDTNAKNKGSLRIDAVNNRNQTALNLAISQGTQSIFPEDDEDSMDIDSKGKKSNKVCQFRNKANIC